MIYRKKKIEYFRWRKLRVCVAWAVIAWAVMSAGCGKLDKAIPISMSTDEAEVAEWLAQGSGAAQGGGAVQGSEAAQGGGAVQGSEAAQGGGAVQGSGTAQEYAGAEIAAQDTGQQALIYVFVCGAVRQAGVVVLPAGSRGKDALEAAGGFAEDADREAVNLASLLYDGQKLYFPSEGEDWAEDAGQAVWAGQLGAAANQGSAGGMGSVGSVSGAAANQGGTGQAASGLVNINTADVALLCTLPGIGETRAKAIIAYREQKGSFGKVEDIMKVSGIKEGAFGKIKELITVN